MSLINEALKKARIEAAQRDAARHGISIEALPRHLPTAQPSPWWRWTAVATGLALVAMTVLLAFQLRSGPRVSAEARPTEVPSASITSAAVAAAVDSGDPPVAAQPSVRRQPAAPVAPAEVGPIEAVEAPEEVDPPVAAGAQEIPNSNGPQPAQIESHAPGRFLRRAVLPSGATFELSGIAWSNAYPMAVLNDRIVAEGDTIDGFTVVDIQPQQIELDRDGRTVVITLK